MNERQWNCIFAFAVNTAVDKGYIDDILFEWIKWPEEYYVDGALDMDKIWTEYEEQFKDRFHLKPGQWDELF